MVEKVEDALERVNQEDGVLPKQSRNSRAFLGALLRLQVNIGIPVITAQTFLHTAYILYTLAKRLQYMERMW